MSKKKSYAQETADRLRKEGNFADADVDVNDVIKIIEDDESYINGLERQIRQLTKRCQVAEVKLNKIKKLFEED